MRRPLDYLGGAVLLVTVMVMGTATLIGFLALSQASLSRIVDADNTIKAFDMRTKVYGCLAEVLIQWRKDLNWSEGSIDTGQAECDLSISSPAPDQRRAEIRFDDGIYYFGVDVVIDTDTHELLELDMAL